MPIVDLTRTNRDVDDDFDPNKALENAAFGDFDPNNYMDAAQTSDSLKALLEGAFEDDDDKPKTRARRKKQQDAAAASLADKLSGLNIEGKAEEEEEEEDVDDGTVDGLNVQLLPHQIDGLSWMLDKEIGERKKNGVLPKGGILADDMGLGKTIQALSLILSNPRPSAEEVAADKKLKKAIPPAAGKSTLVVAPLALIKQWESEIKTKVNRDPPLKVRVHHGPSRTRRADELKKFDVVITTYQTLTSEHDPADAESGIKVGCMGVHWYRIILDEAHSIKNRAAKMTKAAYKLDSVYRWCLTGTPMQNNLDELQSLICFLRIKPYNDMANWKAQIGGPMKNGRGGIAMKRLQYFLKAFMKRRTKEVLKKEGGLNFGKGAQKAGEGKTEGFKIVARDVETIVAEFDPYERELYDKLAARTEKSLENMMGAAKTDYIGALVLLLRLRQTCNHPELAKGNLRKDKDAMPIGAQTPRKASVAEDTSDLDDVADMFGALTVKTKKCDTCQLQLSKEQVDSGDIRCAECAADFTQFEQRRESTKVERKTKTKMESPMNQQPRRKLHTKRIIDSEDEEEEGEWLVPESSRQHEDLGKAGDTDDEDAEGGGQDLGSEDSDTGDETELSNYGKLKSRNRSSSLNDSDDEDSSDEASTHAHDPLSSTKIRHLLTILKRESPDHKTIVFSEFTSMLDLIQPFLLTARLPFTRYDGSMPNPDREASLLRLRTDPACRVLLCSLKCGALGLNLTAASRVVILEPFWNPFVEEQAIDRVHRLNQTRDVKVYRITIRDSVEERILQLQEKKRELAKAAIDGGGMKGGAKLTMSDIMSLFRRDAETDGRHEDAAVSKLGSARAGLLDERLDVRETGSRVPSGGAYGSGGNDRERQREKPRGRVPSGAAQFDASFGRRW